MKKLFKVLLFIVLMAIILSGCASKKNKDGALPPINKWIALTFDDGPSGNTDRLLNLLRDYDIKATFFVTGSNLVRPNYSAVIQRKIDEGHEIANHAHYHVDLGEERTREPIRENIKMCQDAIREITGSDTLLFRPPYLSRSNLVDDVVREMGMVFISGYSPNDWDVDVGPSRLTERVINNVRDGSIVVLHDFGNNNTLEAIPDIAYELRRKGFGFVTVSELIEIKRVTLVPGRWYDRF